MTEPLRAKQTYRVKHKLEAFYTGGAARISRDGKLVACACGDAVKVIELATGSVARTFAGDSEPITALSVSPDCKILVAASRSLVCKSYDLESGAVLRTWRGHKAPVADMAFDPSAGYIATASADRSVKVWDTKGGYATHNFVGHSGVVLKVLWHPRQLMLFSGGDDAEVRVWDLVDKSCVAVLKGHFSAVTSLALSMDGWVLLSAGRDKVVHLWDIRTHAKISTVPIYEAVEGMVSLPAGCGMPGVGSAQEPVGTPRAKKAVYFATAGEKGLVRVWRSDTAACVYTQPQPPGAVLAAATASPAGSEYVDLALLPGKAGLLACTGDARLLVLTPEEVDGKAQLSLSRQLIGNHDEVTDVRFLGPLGEPTHLAVATNSEAVRLFRLSNLSCVASLLGHRDIVLCLDAMTLPGGGSVVASGSKDAEVRLWEAPSGRCLGLGVGHIGAVSAVALSRKVTTPATQRFLVTAGSDKLLKVWALAPALQDGAAATASNCAVVPAFIKHLLTIDSPIHLTVVIQHMGADLALAGAGPVQLKVTAAVAAHDKDINSVAVAPNDTLVATGSQDRTARVWRLPNLVPVVTLRGHKRGVWSVEFSPVEKALLTASGDKTIKLWNLVDGACLKTFEGHTASVLRATYLTAGSQVLSCGADGLVKLWGVRDSECINTLDEHEDKIWALCTGGVNEALIATGGADALVAIWQDTTLEDVAIAEEKEELLAEKEQELRNALAANNFADAARLAFDLKHPGRLLSVLSRLSGGDGSTSSVLLSGLAAHLGPDDLKTALEYVREWNTNARNCHAAHALLRAVLRHHSPTVLLAVPGAAEMLNGMLAYSQRHFARLDRLVRSSFLLDYTLDSMQVLRMEAAGQAGADIQAAAADVAALDQAADVQLPPLQSSHKRALGASYEGAMEAARPRSVPRLTGGKGLLKSSCDDSNSTSSSCDGEWAEKDGDGVPSQGPGSPARPDAADGGEDDDELCC